MANHRILSRNFRRTRGLLLVGLTLASDVLAEPDSLETDAELVVPSQAGAAPSPPADSPSPLGGGKTGPTLPESAAAAPPTASRPTPAAAPTSTVVSAPEGPSAIAPAREAVKTAPSPSVEISGYVQAQLEFHQDSRDQLMQSGALANQDRFLIRRGRVRIFREWAFSSLAVEFDGSTSKGPSARLQKAEASVFYRHWGDSKATPLLQLTGGIFDLPFGFEMTDSSKTRWFMERSIVSRALFPGEPDAGARLHGAASFVRYSLALTNGEPLDERSGLGLQDPNANKDVTVRLGIDTQPLPRLRVASGFSYNVGKGFHAGTTATKGVLTATDSNGDGTPERFEYSAGKAATPSENFKRWAIGTDLQLRVTTWLGTSMLYGELVVAQNLDRGLVVADPTLDGVNVREFGGYIGVTQELSQYFICGIRGDYYDPNSDFLDDRADKQVPTSIRVLGVSPMVGLVLPERARLLLQWDLQDNRFARDSTGVPTRLKNNSVTARLQVNL